MPRGLILLVVVLAVAGCRSAPAADSQADVGPGAGTAVEAVERLRTALIEGDFETAGALGVPGQAVLVSLAEGATPAEVMAALESGGNDIASNFWSGFAQGAGAFLEGEASVEPGGTVNESGIEFTLVTLTTGTGASQRMATRVVDGYRVDIFASFGAALAARLVSPVELLLEAPTPEARQVLVELEGVVASLRVAATDRQVSAQTTQEILRVIEMITRLG